MEVRKGPTCPTQQRAISEAEVRKACITCIQRKESPVAVVFHADEPWDHKHEQNVNSTRQQRARSQRRNISGNIQEGNFLKWLLLSLRYAHCRDHMAFKLT